MGVGKVPDYVLEQTGLTSRQVDYIYRIEHGGVGSGIKRDYSPEILARMHAAALMASACGCAAPVAYKALMAGAPVPLRATWLVWRRQPGPQRHSGHQVVFIDSLIEVAYLVNSDGGGVVVWWPGGVHGDPAKRAA